MDVIREIKQSKKQKVVSINVRKFYTNVDGVKLNPATLPISLQKKMPVYLFNKFDIMGGHSIAAGEAPVLSGLYFIRSFTKSLGYDFTQFSGLNNVSDNIRTGDYIFLYADDPLNPNFFVWVIHQSAGTLKPVSSIYHDDGVKFLQKIKIYPPNVKAFNQQLSVIEATKYGDYDFNQISQRVYRYPDILTDQFLQIPLKLCLDQYTGFTTYIPFDDDEITYQFYFMNEK